MLLCAVFLRQWNIPLKYPNFALQIDTKISFVSISNYNTCKII